MKRPYNAGPVDFTTSRLLLCEGPHDRAFLRALVDNRCLPACDIWCSRDLSKVAGRAGFSKGLFAIRSYASFHRCTEIIIVTDSDANPLDSFTKTQRLIADVEATSPPDAKHTYAVPDAPHTRKCGKPDVGILLVPWFDTVGALETLCYESFKKHADPEKINCVEEFANCANIASWLPQKADKFRLRAALASSFSKNPDISLAQVWDECPDLIDIRDTCFDKIVDFLQTF